MKISDRLIKVYNYLKIHNKTSIEEICTHLDISQRSARYEIDNINYILQKVNLKEVEKLPKGELRFYPDKNIYALFEELTKVEAVSKEERISFLILKLLIDGKINVSKVSRQLDVSRSTIKNDLKCIEEIFIEDDIKLINNNVVALENDIRRCLLKNYYSMLGEFYHIEDETMRNVSKVKQLIYQYIENIDIGSVKVFVESLGTSFDIKDSKFYELIFAYLIISYLRIKKGYKVKSISNKAFLKSTSEYKRLLNIIDSMKNIREENEILMLTDYILGFVSYEYNTLIFENWIKITILIKEIISFVDKYIEEDIINDDILIEGLLNHIKPTIYRCKKNLSIENEIYFESIEGYPELFNIVKKALSKLEKLIGKELCDAEVALITVHFLASIRRNENKRQDKKRILLICGGGYGTSSLVKNILEQNYEVEIVDNISWLQILDYNLKNIDLIISTTKINKDISIKIDIPMVLITPFFTFKDDEILKKYNINRKKTEDKISLVKLLEVIKENTVIKDEEKLKNDLLKIIYKDKKHIEDINHQTLFDKLRDDQIEITSEIKDWQTALKICGGKLIKTNEIKQEYLDEIFNVIDTFGAYFVLTNNVAIPHGQSKENVNTSCMSILYIKKGVIFPGDKLVKLLILIASSEKNILIKTVEKINSLAQKDNLYKELDEAKSKKEIIDYLRDKAV
ncbi:BglG family transcription antiterminator [Brassicibacter mesophilus]|uniref:BglG family transcription antiterminator n=1 Tax=Brassicibacter mesophilus TaxID=745119 RepID=UPI003D19876B